MHDGTIHQTTILLKVCSYRFLTVLNILFPTFPISTTGYITIPMIKGECFPRLYRNIQHEYPTKSNILPTWIPRHPFMLDSNGLESLSGLTFCGWRRDVAGENAIFFSTLETWGSDFVRRCQNCCKTEKLQSPILSTFPLLSTLPSDGCALSELMESRFFAIWVEPTSWHAAPKHRSVPFVAGENQILLLICQSSFGVLIRNPHINNLWVLF
jgi:hypothetical protein